MEVKFKHALSTFSSATWTNVSRLIITFTLRWKGFSLKLLCFLIPLKYPDHTEVQVQVEQTLENHTDTFLLRRVWIKQSSVKASVKSLIWFKEIQRSEKILKTKNVYYKYKSPRKVICIAWPYTQESIYIFFSNKYTVPTVYQSSFCVNKQDLGKSPLQYWLYSGPC